MTLLESSRLDTTSTFTSSIRTQTPLGNTDLLKTVRIEIGPANYFKQQNEQIVKNATELIKLPPNHYCIIKNPVVRSKEGELVSDS